MPAKKGTAIPDDLTNLQYNMVIVEMADGKSLHNNVLLHPLIFSNSPLGIQDSKNIEMYPSTCVS